MDIEERKEIRKVEKQLEKISENTGTTWWRPLFNGALQGAGIVIGTILTVALLGWVLSIFGIIPGFGELATQLQQIMNKKF
jgi:hypothetical protein